MSENVLTVELLDKAMEIMREPPKSRSPTNPYLLPNRAHWRLFPPFWQEMFERDLQSGTGVLPEKLIELGEE